MNTFLKMLNEGTANGILLLDVILDHSTFSFELLNLTLTWQLTNKTDLITYFY